MGGNIDWKEQQVCKKSEKSQARFWIVDRTKRKRCSHNFCISSAGRAIVKKEGGLSVPPAIISSSLGTVIGSA